MPTMPKDTKTYGEPKTTSPGMQRKRRGNETEQNGEEEWDEICWRNPIKRLRRKTKKEEYIRQLKEEIRKGKTRKRRGGEKGAKENEGEKRRKVRKGIMKEKNNKKEKRHKKKRKKRKRKHNK